MADEPGIDEIVSWQMTGMLTRKAPTCRKSVPPRCAKCAGEWHGLPTRECVGSFDTPET